jgi:hypothetical protein
MGKRTVLFLGAGASAPFGYPLTKAIFTLIDARLRTGKLFRRDPADFPRAADAEGRLRRYLDDFLPGCRENDAELPPITDVLSLIDHLLLAQNVPLLRLRSQDVRDFRELLERAILEALNEPSDQELAAQGKPLLDRLAKWIYDSALTRGNSMAIISTNYDIVLESVLYERLDPTRRDLYCKVDYGFSWRQPFCDEEAFSADQRLMARQVQLHRIASDASGGEALRHRPEKPVLGLYKLHGSLNWLRCALCDHVYINTFGSIYHQAFKDKVDDQNCCSCGHGPLQPVIVAPSMVRDIRDMNLLAIWQSALETLRTADELIIVGYSLPTEDIAIRSMFLRACRRPALTIRVIQKEPDADTEKRYRFLFPESAFPQFSFEVGGLEAFIAQLGNP